MRRKKQMTACLLSFALLLGMIPANEVSAAKKVSLSTKKLTVTKGKSCLLYTSPSPRDKRQSRMPSSA